MYVSVFILCRVKPPITKITRGVQTHIRLGLFINTLDSAATTDSYATEFPALWHKPGC